MPVEDPSTPEKSFLSIILKRWHYISPVLELAAAIVLFFHLIPTPFEENLKETTLGLWIIFLIISVFLIVQNLRQSRNVKTLLSKNELLNERISQLMLENQAESNERREAENYKRLFALNNKAFAKLREAHRDDMTENNQKNLHNAIREFCDNLHEAFATINGLHPDNPCHVCIKIFTQSANTNYKGSSNVKVKLKTLMRDGRGKGERGKIDAKRIDHFVHENTDFLEIFESAGELEKPRYFICNDLVNYPDYKNSSFKNHNPNGSISFKHEQAPAEIKEGRWPLPYRSVITAPICPGISNPNLRNGTFIGFLCCDYEQKSMFSDRDVDIVLGFAEGLYDVLDYYIKQYLLKSHYV